MSRKVAIGCVVRNRAWILPRYLEALENIDYPNKMYLFLENDSEDSTLKILEEFNEKHLLMNNRKGDYCNLATLNTNDPNWARGEYAANQYANLAFLRNNFIEMFLGTDADYLLSIDSDIIVPPDIINRLMEYADEKTIIGAAISNIPGKPLDGKTPGNFMVRHPNGYMVHPPRYELTGVMDVDVDVIGAVYLIPRKALEDGVRYGPHPQGEDIPFCEQAQEKGYKLKVLLDLVCDHRMIRD
ncbi:hypothetical protein DNHGIG_25790 [Collibacillus ludicampi]|uniref:Glycosyltransferase 2-like domain-containing protein n=1 Tax=Collibacillus ludicampi TaxID=2771369 RepID=A0AAV4LGN7_9BACL|nr:glycosyltransferase [Collibacillus ludicampi]GIM47030.1 hypothetical protein DNHGIG_25790 [Collibacillus ludicampi]